MTVGQTSAVTFKNREGLTLFGILHRPDNPVENLAVVLLSPGVKSRVAPHRLYNKIAAALVADGITVFRFDFHGLGDSEGELAEEYLADLYGEVQIGRYVGDTLAALDWMQRIVQVDRIILGGLCGGAITGLLAAMDDERVAGLLAIGIPVTLDSAVADPVRYMTRRQLDDIRGKYMRKVGDPSSWLRVLTLRTDFRLLGRSIAAAVKRSSRQTPAGTAAPADSARTPSAPAEAGNLNPRFAPAFLRLLERSRPALLLFSGADRLYWEFEDKFMAFHRSAVEAAAPLVDVHVIQEANHVLTFDQWQEEMLARTRQWLRRCFPHRRAAERPEAVMGASS